MKNYAALTLSISILIGLGFGISSCKEDEPPVPPKLSFAEPTMTVSEAEGVIEVDVILDKPYSKDLNIEYELGGTASDQDAVGSEGADYEVDGTHGVVEIPSGQTSGTIEIEIYSDAEFEADETIEISIMDLNTDEIQLTSDDEAVITITNDDEQLTASFVSATLTANEASGLLQLAVQLDNPAYADLIIEYTLEGSAVDSTTAWYHNQGLQPGQPGMSSDYHINDVTDVSDATGHLVIPADATSANIEIQPYSDFLWETDETIEITLTGGDVEIGTNNTMSITLEQENGKVIALQWEGYADVDMDLFLWVGETPDNLNAWMATSLNIGPEPPEEHIIFPTTFMAIDELATFSYGLSYNYYSGTADSLTFKVQFADFTDGMLEAEATREIFTATYTAANKNPWDSETEGTSPLIAQTFKLVTGDFAEISDPITVHASGSRIKSRELPKGPKKQSLRPARLLN